MGLPALIVSALGCLDGRKMAAGRSRRLSGVVFVPWRLRNNAAAAAGRQRRLFVSSIAALVSWSTAAATWSTTGMALAAACSWCPQSRPRPHSGHGHARLIVVRAGRGARQGQPSLLRRFDCRIGLPSNFDARASDTFYRVFVGPGETIHGCMDGNGRMWTAMATGRIAVENVGWYPLQF